jgi:hypothetical protein
MAVPLTLLSITGTSALAENIDSPSNGLDSDVESCLIIALDMSESVTLQEWQLQTYGLALGFAHDAAKGAADSRGKFAILDMVYGNQTVTSNDSWHIVDTAADMQDLGTYFMGLDHQDHIDHHGMTNVIGVTSAAIDRMADCPNPEAEKIIYVLGNGADDMAIPYPGYSPAQIELRRVQHNQAIADLHEKAHANGNITINGSSFGDYDIDQYFADNIVSPFGHNFKLNQVSEGFDNGTNQVGKAVILQVVRHTM